MGKRAIVIFADAMVYEDLQTLRKLPTFSGVWDRMAQIKRVRSVYPLRGGGKLPKTRRRPAPSISGLWRKRFR